MRANKAAISRYAPQLPVRTQLADFAYNLVESHPIILMTVPNRL